MLGDWLLDVVVVFVFVWLYEWWCIVGGVDWDFVILIVYWVVCRNVYLFMILRFIFVWWICLMLCCLVMWLWSLVLIFLNVIWVFGWCCVLLWVLCLVRCCLVCFRWLVGWCMCRLICWLGCWFGWWLCWCLLRLILVCCMRYVDMWKVLVLCLLWIGLLSCFWWCFLVGCLFVICLYCCCWWIRLIVILLGWFCWWLCCVWWWCLCGVGWWVVICCLCCCRLC